MSVRSAAEVGAALAGGADVVDAKEPARGGLGAVDLDTLRTIAGRVPAATPLSVALGDFTAPAEVHGAIRGLPIVRAAGELFLKLGFAGAPADSLVAGLIAAAVEAAARTEPAAGVVAVAYADWRNAGSPPPEAVSRAAAQMGAAGVLLDTSNKAGPDLFGLISQPALGAWVADARRAGLLVAVAGSLGAERFPFLRDLQADIVGVRGAACDGGRLGQVSAARVRALRSELDAHGGYRPGREVPAKRQTTAPPSLP